MNPHPKPSFIVPRKPSIDRRYRPMPDAKVNLFNSISEEEYDTESERYSIPSSSCASSIVNSVEGASIYLRFRPTIKDTFSENYTIKNNVLIAKHLQNNETNLTNKNIEKHFTFTDIFSGFVNQSKIYETCVRPKIEDDENFTVMTYGTSGSGKTFTLIGDLENPGILPRALENIFQIYSYKLKYNPSLRLKNGEISIDDDERTYKTISTRKELLNNCSDVKNLYNRVQHQILSENNFETHDESASISIWISFIEIYNEIVYDLLELDLKSRKSLKVITNNGKVFIKNLTSIFVENSLEAYKLLTYGLKRLTYGSTGINANSSRSHCIFFVDIIKFNELHKKLTHISYKFCDLAGSERLGKTGNVGSRLKESQRINTSLMVLGRCLDAASNNHNKKNPNVIPIRESKLTMILQASLLGNEKIAMIVNITPTEQYYEENLNVLGFSSIAKNIYYKPCERKPKQTRFSWFANSIAGGSDNSSSLLYEENMSLRTENERLQAIMLNFDNQLEEQEIAIRKELVDKFEEDMKKRSKRWENHLISQEKYLRKSFRTQIEALKRHYERKLSEQEDDDIQIVENDSDEQEENIDNSDNKKRRVESI